MPMALAAVVGLIAVTAVTVRIVSASASGCSGTLALRVSATPEIAAPLQRIGADWMASKPEVAGRCVELTVLATPAAVVAGRLTLAAGKSIDVAATPGPTPAGDPLPDVWVPDSTGWLGRVQLVDRTAFAGRAASIATSPVVLAMAQSDARQLGWPARGVQIADLRPQLAQGGPLRLAVAEPRRETASLVAAMVLGESLATSDAELPALVKAFRGVIKAPSTVDLLRGLGGAATAGPASEQAVVTYDATHPPTSIAAVPLEPAPPNLDYPYAIRSGISREASQAAEQFRAAVLGGPAVQILAAAAFRDPDGRARAGFPPAAPIATVPFSPYPVDDPERVQRALALWSAANTPSRTLALFDVTSSMRAGAGGGRTRTGVMTAAATEGLSLFAADSRVGMWVFADSHHEVLPVDTLTPARRVEFADRMADATPTRTNRAELYSTLLAAYRTMRDGYDPTRPNIIIVLTDGGDDTAGGLARATFSQQVQQLADATRPIRIVLIGIDVAPADEADLQAIADVVGGGYFRLASPGQIQTIFLKALLQVGAA